MDRSNEIPEPFYRDEAGVVLAYTVGELKKALNALPDDLPIDDCCVRLTVPNVKTSPYLMFDAYDQDWD